METTCFARLASTGFKYKKASRDGYSEHSSILTAEETKVKIRISKRKLDCGARNKWKIQ